MKFIAKSILSSLAIFTSLSVCNAALETRIINLKDRYVEKGNIVTLKARGQFKKASGWTDIDSEYLNFTILSNDRIMFSKRSKISFWDGNAMINVNTSNFAPGNYKINLKFEGNLDLLPSEANARLIVLV
ncbi:MAG TPA: hypothetical protein VK426_08940 [Methanobacterium sp.]|nr:hypothetical protein [Methanobacterium sp.]